jgi:recombination protein RecA
MIRKKRTPLSTQMTDKVKNGKIKKLEPEFNGNTETVISTGSTLLDLAISGGRVKGGGIPGGILVEIFGPESSGKTVLLCEIAGNIQRGGGDVMFHDPEARLNKQFAQIFGLRIKDKDHSTPNTIPEVFQAVRNWEPEKSINIHGVFADSLAALSTDLEMDNDDGDKMGMRRAKEFSEELRKTCRILAKNNYLMVCSNQIRESTDVSFGKKYHSPGGKAIGFYSSLRLRAMETTKKTIPIKFAGKDVKRAIGVRTFFEVSKSSIWKPFRTAPVTILFDYGIDDIRENLQFIKDYTKANTYAVLGKNLDKSMETSIKIIEAEGWEKKLKFQTIELWESIEEKFNSNRKTKVR